MISGTDIYCPLCDDHFPGSRYLATVFSSRKQLWLANMVTHYRHEHINYYNRWVYYHSYFRSYGDFKTTVNNRAKRQMIRKCLPFLRKNGITANDFAALQGTDRKTLELAHKKLGGTIPPRAQITTTLDMFTRK